MDTSVRRGPEIGSDNYVVVTIVREKNGMETKNRTQGYIKSQSIRSYK